MERVPETLKVSDCLGAASRRHARDKCPEFHLRREWVREANHERENDIV